MNWEFAVLDFFQKYLHSDLATLCMKFFTMLGEGGIFFIVCTLILLLIPRTRKTGAMMAVSLILEALLCNVLLKPMVARIRPYDVNTDVLILVRKPSDYSFPSGHTGAAFAVAGALLFSKNRYRYAALVLGILIGLSRLYFYVHYPTDVLTGALLGLFTGWASVQICRFVESRLSLR
jgi:undecaprenyl-diphosphatase